MSGFKRKAAVVTRIYQPAPDACEKAIRLLLLKPVGQKAAHKLYPHEARRLTT
jgi:hypothetical protein